jgi:DNA-binding beta-propeller fold protein YncE
VRTLASEFPAIHAMELLNENGEQFLLCTHLPGQMVLKLTLEGKLVWKVTCPLASGVYQALQSYAPTAATVAPDGSLFIADGYGASVIHKFDSARRYVKTFGGSDAGEGQLSTCHGLAIDRRGATPHLLVCDRKNRRLVHFDFEGNYLGTIARDLRLPCSVAFHGDLMAVAELEGRVSILDPGNQTVTELGDNSDLSERANYEVPPERWRAGVLTAPHGVCFDHAGNLYVQDWNKHGRLNKFVRE